MILILEARHRVVGLLLKEGAGDPSGLLCLEHGQAAAMDQIVHQGGDEHGLAGTRQAGNTKAHRR